MDKDEQKAILESLLFAAGDEGLTLKQICIAMEVPDDVAFHLVEELQAEYNRDLRRGITLIRLAETYQLATKRQFAVYINKLVEAQGVSSLSQAALEALAIIAYKQPITRVEIEEIRGVKTERPLQTLMSKGLIKEVGRVQGVGRARLYGTTREFLDYFGLQDLKELPPLPEPTDSEIEQLEADLFTSNFKETN